MTITRKDVRTWAVGLVFIVMGSATAVLAKVNYQYLESGGQDDPMFVTVTHRSVHARLIEATVTESPVQLREERQSAVPVAVAAAAPKVVRGPTIAAIEAADGRSLQQPKFLVPRRVDSAATLRTTRETPRLVSDAAGHRRSAASVLRELRQLREENLVLKRLVNDLSRPPGPTSSRTEAIPQPRPSAVMWARL